jgi:hypothetical protein
MSQTREDSGLLGVIATPAEEGWDGDRNPRVNCTNADVGWAAGVERGKSVALGKEPFTLRVYG